MRQVAIKMFHTIESTSQFKDFQREARIMKNLEHENIVKIYGFREEPLLIIMEYINYKNCGTLQTYVSTRRSDLTVEELLGFASNIAMVRLTCIASKTRLIDASISRECNISNKRRLFIETWLLGTYWLLTRTA